MAEVYQYEEWEKYDSESKDEMTGLFTRYVNSFLKLKQEASGWPAWVQTADDRDMYIARYEEHEGIRLEPSKIEFNAALRSLAKLCLNSFWVSFLFVCDVIYELL